MIGSLQLERSSLITWSEQETQVVITVAKQIVQHIENLRLLSQAEQYRRDAEQALRRLTREGWQHYVETTTTLPEGYTYDGNLVTKDLKLNVRTNKGLEEVSTFELYQNEPNPFNKQTVVSFTLPEAKAATLTMYDVTGKVLRVYEIEGLKGLNTKVINKSELNGNGVIYYQLDAANYTATKRMIVIE